MEAGVNLAREDACRRMRSRGYRMATQGAAMQRPHAEGFNRAGAYVIVDRRSAGLLTDGLRTEHPGHAAWQDLHLIRHTTSSDAEYALHLGRGTDHSAQMIVFVFYSLHSPPPPATAWPCNCTFVRRRTKQPCPVFGVPPCWAPPLWSQ